MKCQEIILQLMKNLPRYSPFFSVKKEIASVSFSLGTATATTTTPHGQVAGSFVSVADVLVPCAVDTVTPVGNTLVLKTLTPHDFTLNRNVPSDQNQVVRITTLLGFSSGYKLLDVPNRKTLVIEQSLVPFPTDPAFVQEKFHYGYNGLKEILTVPTPSSFTYLVDDIALAAPNDISNSPYVGCSIRVSGAADLLTMMNSYTAQPPDNIWACVVLEDNVANKDRRTLNDALTQQGRQMDFAQQLISNFAIYIIIPNKGEVLTETNGRLARDMIEDIRVPIFKTLLGIEFRTDLAAQGESCVTYAGDGFVSFNGVVYVHQFSFQQVLMITSSDTAIESFDRAFRDIDLSIRNQFSDVTAYTVLPVDLDEFP